jgi:hypothetical protein
MRKDDAPIKTDLPLVDIAAAHADACLAELRAAGYAAAAIRLAGA